MDVSLGNVCYNIRYFYAGLRFFMAKYKLFHPMMRLWRHQSMLGVACFVSHYQFGDCRKNKSSAHQRAKTEIQYKKYTWLGLSVGAIFSQMAQAQIDEGANYQPISIAHIEQKLSNQQAHGASMNFAAFSDIHQYSLNQHDNIARLSDDVVPVADIHARVAQIQAQNPVSLDMIGDVDDYVQQQIDGKKTNLASTSSMDVDLTKTKPQPEQRTPVRTNIIKRLYNRFFNDGVESLERLKADIYIRTDLPGKDKHDKASNDKAKLDKGLMNGDQSADLWSYEPDADVALDDSQAVLMRTDDSKQPFKNIKNALENITIDSASDINIAMPRLRSEVVAAARAVGYYDMTFRLQDGGLGKIDVIIQNLGQPVRVNGQIIEIRGADSDSSVIRQMVQDVKPKQNEIFNHGEYTQTKMNIDSLSGEYGFFDGRWLDHSVDVILPDNTANISLVYDAGKQYVFDEVVFFTYDEKTGKYTADPNKLPVNLSLLRQLVHFNSGDPFRASQVSHLTNQLNATNYFNTTNVEVIYPKADTQANDVVSANTNVSEAQPSEQILNLNDGTVATVSPIDFSPSENILSKINQVGNKAEELLALPKNQILSKNHDHKSLLGRISNAVSMLAKAILPDESKDTESQIAPMQFADKKLATLVAQDKKVPLYIFVAADKPRQGQVGLGYGTDVGFRAIGKLEHNLLSRQGYQAGVDVSYSRIEQGVNAYISRPWSHPLNDKVSFNLKYLSQNINQGVGNFALLSKTFEQGLARHIINDSGWNQSYSLRYRSDKLESRSDAMTWQDLPVKFIGQKPSQRALLAGVSLSKTSQLDPLNPLRGYRQKYSLELASQSLLSDANIAILRAGIGGIYSFGDNAYGKDRAHQLVGRLDGGYLWSNNFESVPYKLRFFTGGDTSIRGYGYESLSPLNSAGYLMGGQALMVGSLEYNYEVKEGLRVAVFADAGNAYDKNFAGKTKVGAGLGVRYASPVGTVRVDLASPLGEDKTSVKLHFLIGMPF